jgi:hypothetical protein
MTIAKIILASVAAITIISSGALAQQALTGLITKVDEANGIGDHRLRPHFAHRRVQSLINTDRRSHLRGASGDFPDVVKIAQTRFHRRTNFKA